MNFIILKINININSCIMPIGILIIAVIIGNKGIGIGIYNCFIMGIYFISSLFYVIVICNILLILGLGIISVINILFILLFLSLLGINHILLIINNNRYKFNILYIMIIGDFFGPGIYSWFIMSIIFISFVLGIIFIFILFIISQRGLTSLVSGSTVLFISFIIFINGSLVTAIPLFIILSIPKLVITTILLNTIDNIGSIILFKGLLWWFIPININTNKWSLLSSYYYSFIPVYKYTSIF